MGQHGCYSNNNISGVAWNEGRIRCSKGSKKGQQGLTHLVYGNYLYDHGSSSLTEFKRRNGFEEILVPRYYVPLTFKGKLFLKLGIHHGIKAALPRSILQALRAVRSVFYQRVFWRAKPKQAVEE